MILFKKKRKQEANSRKRLSYQIFWTKMTERERNNTIFPFIYSIMWSLLI